tara:strand:+ start:1603 stop:1779 length:177 start_codon:yes stop_codon:yes gene_type:complete
MKYFNLKTNQGTETVNQISRDEYGTFKEYKAELRRLLYEYRLAGMNVYTSQKACKDWN